MKLCKIILEIVNEFWKYQTYVKIGINCQLLRPDSGTVASFSISGTQNCYLNTLMNRNATNIQLYLKYTVISIQ